MQQQPGGGQQPPEWSPHYGPGKMPGGMGKLPGGMGKMPGGMGKVPGGMGKMPGGKGKFPGGIGKMPPPGPGAPSWPAAPFRQGDLVVPREPHMPEHRGKVARVLQVAPSQPFYVLDFGDGVPHRWYALQELQPAPGGLQPGQQVGGRPRPRGER